MEFEVFENVIVGLALVRGVRFGIGIWGGLLCDAGVGCAIGNGGSNEGHSGMSGRRRTALGGKGRHGRRELGWQSGQWTVPR